MQNQGQNSIKNDEKPQETSRFTLEPRLNGYYLGQLHVVGFENFQRAIHHRDLIKFIEPQKAIDVIVTNYYHPSLRSDTVRPGFVYPFAFAIFATEQEADEFVEEAPTRSNERLNGGQFGQAKRMSYNDVLKALYPTLFDTKCKPGTFINQDGMDQLAFICSQPLKTYNTRNPERPFETFIALIHHFPWHLLLPLLPSSMVSQKHDPAYAHLLNQGNLLKATSKRILQSLYRHVQFQTDFPDHPDNLHNQSKSTYHRVADRLSKRLLRAITCMPILTDRDHLNILKDGHWDPSYKDWCQDLWQMVSNGNFAKLLQDWNEERFLQLRGYVGSISGKTNRLKQPLFEEEIPWLMNNVKHMWQMDKRSLASTPETAAIPPSPEESPIKVVQENGEVYFNGLPVYGPNMVPFRPVQQFDGWMQHMMAQSRDQLRGLLQRILSISRGLADPQVPGIFEQEHFALMEAPMHGLDDVMMLANMILGHLTLAQQKYGTVEIPVEMLTIQHVKQQDPGIVQIHPTSQ